jgi:type IV pilus assembly protein PilV
MRQFKRREEGATLIEIMVSIVVIAIGLLGLAGLQVNALKFQKTSSLRSEAVQAAYDLSERMRSNVAGVLIGQYLYATDYSTTVATVPMPPNDCTVAVCLPAQIAANDIQEWLRGLRQTLVGGAGYVVAVAGAPNTFDVTIMWREQNLAALDPTCPGAAAPIVGVRCFTYRVAP